MTVIANFSDVQRALEKVEARTGRLEADLAAWKRRKWWRRFLGLAK